MNDALLVTHDRAPPIAVQRLQQCEARAVQPRAWVRRGAGQRARLNPQRRGIGGEVAKGEVRDGRVVVRKGRAWVGNRRQEQGGRLGVVFGRGPIERAVLLQAGVAPWPPGKQSAVYIPELAQPRECGRGWGEEGGGVCVGEGFGAED